MLKPTSIKRIVIVYLALQSTIIIALTLLLTYNSVLQSSLPAAIITIALAIIITAYTARRIILSIHEKIANDTRQLYDFAMKLKIMSENLQIYADNLDKRTGIIDEQQKVIKQNVSLINQYGGRMNELVQAIDALSANDKAASISDEQNQDSTGKYKSG